MKDKTTPLVDSHCHLTWKSFTDLDAVCERMLAASVLQAVVVSTDAGVARRAREICRNRDMLFPAAGIHPNDLPDDWEREFGEIENLMAEGDFVAVGETGLDYYRDRVPRERQRAAFERHADLARKEDLPIIVHIREQEGRQDAYDDVALVLAEFPGLSGVIHCYTGDVAHAERYRDLGFLISFAGIITFPKGDNVREVAAATPLEVTMVETDSPFLAPQPWRGKRNEPAFVAVTAVALAEVKGVCEDEVRRVTTRNARALFRLPATG